MQWQKKTAGISPQNAPLNCQPGAQRGEGVGLQDSSLPDQVMVDNSVEVAVVHGIIHMAILVIVLPPRLDGQEVPIGLTVPMTVLHFLIL